MTFGLPSFIFSLMEFKPERIICHHSLTKDSPTVSWGAIRRYHIETLHWSDIGYHMGVEMVKSGDELYYEALMGRMWDKQGAHCRGENHNSLAICLIGNFDYHKPPDAQLIAGAKIISLWMKLYNIKIDDIYGHRDFSTKTCPGKLFDLEDLKHYIS